MLAAFVEWKRIHKLVFCLLIVSVIACVPALGQTVTTVENLGVVSATQMNNGLGFNVNPANDWELQYAAAAGAKEVRIQCGWASTEVQTAQNTSGGFVMPGPCGAALKSAANYHLNPLMIAAYGPPYHALLTLKVTANVPVGAYTIPVTATTGTLSQVNVPYCHVYEQNGTQITAFGRYAYEGALITAVDTTANTLTLSAATTVAVASGTLLTVNQVLYPSVATTDPTDPSIVAYAGPGAPGYGGLVGFWAKSMADVGLTGRVEIWNEPTWANDPWDMRDHFYDNTANIPKTVAQDLDQDGFVKAMVLQTPPKGITYEWGYTHKSGFNSLLGPRNPHPTQAQAAITLGSESFHPYGNDPEDGGWDPTCLALLNGWGQCILQGLDPADNFKAAVQYNLQNIASYGWGIDQGITETGTTTGDQNAKARFIMREYAMYMGLGIKWIDFFQMSTLQPGYGFVDGSTTPGTVLQPYLAIKGFMADVATITGAATPTYTDAEMPTISSYLGYYNLAMVRVTGSKTAVKASNPQMLIVWQRSIVPNQTVSWLTMASPTAVPLTIQLPAGMKVSAATNMTKRTAVSFTANGQLVTFAVADDPVSVMIVPVPALKMTLASSTLTMSPGSTQSNTDVVTLAASGGLNATVALSCTVAVSGQTTATALPTCAFSNPNVVLTDGSTATSTLSIYSTAAQGEVRLPAPMEERGGMSGIRFAVLAFLLVPAWTRRRSLRKLRAVMVMLLLVAGVSALTGCGGPAGKSSSAGGAVLQATTSGTYLVTVKATANNSGTAASATSTVALTIQ